MSYNYAILRFFALLFPETFGSIVRPSEISTKLCCCFLCLFILCILILFGYLRETHSASYSSNFLIILCIELLHYSLGVIGGVLITLLVLLVVFERCHLILKALLVSGSFIVYQKVKSHCYYYFCFHLHHHERR